MAWPDWPWPPYLTTDLRHWVLHPDLTTVGSIRLLLKTDPTCRQSLWSYDRKALSKFDCCCCYYFVFLIQVLAAKFLNYKRCNIRQQTVVTVLSVCFRSVSAVDKLYVSAFERTSSILLQFWVTASKLSHVSHRNTRTSHIAGAREERQQSTAKSESCVSRATGCYGGSSDVFDGFLGWRILALNRAHAILTSRLENHMFSSALDS